MPDFPLENCVYVNIVSVCVVPEVAKNYRPLQTARCQEGLHIESG